MDTIDPEWTGREGNEGMRLDQAGTATTLDELCARYADRPWRYMFDEFPKEERRDAAAAGTVRRIDSGLRTDELIETGYGPYIVVVEGDLVTAGHVDLDTDDYVPGLVIVTGGLQADSLSYDNGAQIVVGGSADIARVCVGRHGDRNGVFHVYGELTVPLMAVDLNSTFGAESFRGLLLARGRVEGREPDLVEVADNRRLFPAELLSEYGGLDLPKVIAAARAGRPLLLPGVAESIPARLLARPHG